MIRRPALFAPASVLFTLSCGGGAPPSPAPSTPPNPPAPREPALAAEPSAAPAAATPAPGSFEDDVAFLRQHGDVVVLEGERGAKVAVSPKYQGRVMTSTVGPGGRSLGWVNRKFITAGKTGTPFDNYGGEDRLWLGPEGGQFGLYFPPGKPFAFDQWQTPAAFQEGEWPVVTLGPARPPAELRNNVVVFHRTMTLKNWSGTEFTLVVKRTVHVLAPSEVAERLGAIPSAKWVAFETVNEITNAGTRPWTKDKGLLSVWILAMFPPAADAVVAIPYDARGAGPKINDRYFGKVPADRLTSHEEGADGTFLFKCDGQSRSKIGVGPGRAKDRLGSYSPSAELLTIVTYDKPAGAASLPYVNSMWEKQKEPYGGDAVNSYNDGPVAPGQPPLGGFFEMETSSPGATLAPGKALVHTHRTFHIVGDRAALDPIATRMLGVSATRMAQGVSGAK